MNRRHLSINIFKEFLFKENFALHRQLVVFLLLTFGLLTGFFWINRSKFQPTSKIHDDCVTPNQLALKDNKNIKPQSLKKFQVAEVISESGATRNAPSEESIRLTPLPKGTRAIITETKKDWLRLDYGVWINKEDAQVLSTTVIPRSFVCDTLFREKPGKTEVVFPLQAPVPVTIQQGEGWFGLTLHNSTLRQEMKPPENDRVISRMSWQQFAPGQVRYGFNFKNRQQWGYSLRYENNNLILSFRQSPFTQQEGFLKSVQGMGMPLSGMTIVIDPGHGGLDSGAISPNGYKEKELALTISQLLRQQLELRGATVYFTREDDVDVSLAERMAIINRLEPTLALSIHYNHVPDNVDGGSIKGIATYWYHPQSTGLAKYLNNYIVKQLSRADNGVKWKNLALARPTIAPSVLLELGFMSNPQELNWIINPGEQSRLAQTIADGVAAWFESVK
ncbi:MAG: N-acetylmuramoyl-L-alanine amidase [Scytonematopsis contorta HA4267-MV1]|jgi:N-acetylmuramoyl-L-alanine amidase|nr:N-acetylmuramoyl-L-alanine amidase [Scytonematopsis contorta HA4267-MV1]